MRTARPMEKTQTGRVALVTGGASGIGAATVRELSRRGRRVALTYLQHAETAVALASEVGGLAVELDLHNRIQMRQAIATVGERLGPIEIVVLNAGGTRDALATFLPEAEWDRIVDLNLSSAFRLVQLVLRDMLRAGFGRIVAVSSASGRIGQVGQTAYSAAKGGLISFVKALAREVGPFGVTVNAVAPGWIRTPLLDSVLSEEQIQRHLELLPLRRVGEPEDVAAAIGYLTSEEASYVTGQVLSVDGGLVMS